MKHPKPQVSIETDIAIVGMSSLFAKARHLDEYWKNIVEEVNCITEVPENRWQIGDYFSSDVMAPDKSYSKVGGFIPEVNFNPMEFGLPPNIIELTDSSQLLSLVMAKAALENAGYWQNEKFSKEIRQRTGVILGVGGGQKLFSSLTARLQYPIWEKTLKAYGIPDKDIALMLESMKSAYPKWEENSFPGLLGNVIAGRITNRFDLGGTNCVVDAACASSLSAIKMAVMELQLRQVDMIITGGVDTDNSPGMYLSFSKTPAFSRENKSRPFDDSSDGIVISEGIGMLILKRLSDAERDGDRIYSVIKAIGSSSDGKNKSIYAPQSSGQALALQRTYEQAGYEMSTIGLLECHGTGTPAGDPSEVDSLKIHMAGKDIAAESIALGSIKSQIGHAKTAAGAASIIKTALALYNKVLPASINVTTPNKQFNIETTPYYINATTRPWIKPTTHPRRASVSAFGFGGTNFHVAMEEYQAEHTGAYRSFTSAYSILLTGATKQAIIQSAKSVISKINDGEAEEVLFEIAEQSSSLTVDAKLPRLGLVAVNREDALQKLSAAISYLEHNSGTIFENPKGFFYCESNVADEGKTAALFSGQGSQYVNMAEGMASHFPPFREILLKLDLRFEKDNAMPLSKVVYPVPAFTPEKKEAQKQKLTQTEYAQPAIGAISAAYFKLLKSAGFKADMVAGHSFGELTALWASEVVDEDDYLLLARERGKAMAAQSNADAGAMLAVSADENKVREMIATMPGIVVANVNAGSQIVLGGSSESIDHALTQFQTAGISAIKLPVSAAFHTSFVEHAAEPFAKAISKVKFNQPAMAVYSNTTGKKYPKTVEAIKSTLSKHIVNPVLFKDEIEQMYNDGARIFIEFGPKGVLTNLVKKILQGKEFFAFAMNGAEDKGSEFQFKETCLKMKVAGIRIGNPDIYQAPVKKTIKAEKLNMVLSGANYWSETSSKAYADGLEKIKQLQLVKIKESAIPAQAPPAAVVMPAPVEKKVVGIESGAIEAVLAKQLLAFREMSKLMEEQVRLLESLGIESSNLSNVKASPQINIVAPVATSVERKIENAPQHPVMQSPVPQQTASGPDLASINHAMLQVVSDKTGYPTEMLEMDMDMEADLGIDSIKRVEIFGAMQEAFPNITGANPKEMAVLKTLSQIVDYLGTKLGATQSTTVTVSTPSVAASPAADLGLLTQAMLQVVSDKTGYPTEMLEMDMDMEADLGIDSIKRVEIFGAMQEAFPGITGANPKEMAVLKTLRQIVDYLGTKLGATQNTTVAASTPAVATSPAANLGELTQAMLQVVSDKTGYPTEMLEMDMDMEADLGIDSIKRVEIFGAMQEAFHGITGANPKEMAVLKTLRQIVDYLGTKLGATQNTTIVASTPAVASSSAADLGELTQAMLQIVSDKTGYPTDMLEMDMDMEADLGIDSIKRVEIFGAMQQAFPTITGANPKEMAILKTLGQIVDYLGTKLGGSANTITEPSKISEVKPDDKIKRFETRLKFLPRPDKLFIPWSESNTIVVLNDGGNFVHELTAQLLTLPVTVALINLPGTPETSQPSQNRVKHIYLKQVNDEAIKVALEEAAGLTPHLTGVICTANAKQYTEISDCLGDKDLIKANFFIAKHYKQLLDSKKRSDVRNFFISVSFIDGALGIGNKNNLSLIQGANPGLIKTLSQEWHHVFCRAIDVAPDKSNAEAAAIVLDELHDPNLELKEVAYSDSQRRTIIAEQVDPMPGALNQIPVTQEDVFLVTGGAKGITSTCVQQLAQYSKAKFILIGRSSIDQPEPAWAIGCTDEKELKKRIADHLKQEGKKPLPADLQRTYNQIISRREIENTLAELKAAGSEALYFDGDVRDEKRLTQIVAEASAKLGKITGIVHGAGALADKLIENKSEQDFELVFSIKVAGILSLLKVLPVKDLKYLLLFSSVAGFYGNTGQADYALSNEFLNKLAFYISNTVPSCKVVSYNWGPWEGGMVSPELKKLFEEKNVFTIPLGYGAQIFVNELSRAYAGNIQVVVGSALPVPKTPVDDTLRSYTISRKLILEENPFLKDHVIAGHAVLPAVNSVLWITNACRQLYPGMKVFAVTNSRVYKGIVFDKKFNENFTLEIKEIKKNESEIVLEGALTSMLAGDKKMFHYKALVQLIPDLPEAPKFPTDHTSLTPAEVDAGELYANGTLFHGPSFQGITEVMRIDEQSMLLKCMVPKLSEEDQGQFPAMEMNPYIIDVQYQGLLIWAKHLYNAASLPVELERGENYNTLEFGKEYFVSFKRRESSASEMIADICIYDVKGDVHVNSIGAKIVISKELNDAFLNNKTLN